MRTIHKIGIGILVGLFFASGYATRIYSADHSRVMTLKSDDDTVGVRVASSRLSDVANVDIGPVDTLYTVLRYLREHYVEQLTVADEGKMTYDAVRAMLASLGDPNTRFIEPKQRKLLDDAEHGKFHGIGAVLAIKQTLKPNKEKPKEPLTEEHLIVVSLLPGSPAAKAGLKSGDEIISIDGKDVLPFNPYQRLSEQLTPNKTKNMQPTQLKKIIDAEQQRIDNGIGVIEAEQQLISPAEKPIELTIAAKAPAKPAKVTVTPEDLTVQSVDQLQMESNDYGRIKVNYFGADTAAKFADTMKELEAKSAKGLIIDLRGASGGNIKSAENVAGWFAPDKPVAMLVRSRGRKYTLKAAASQDMKTWNKPLVVLVDHSTSRIPEVLAAGLKESASAKIVGEKTYGDFIDTTVMDLADGSAVVMATGKYITAKGVDYNGKGLPVDAQTASGIRQTREPVRQIAAGGKS